MSNQQELDYGDQGNVRFLRARAFQRDIPKRQYPFGFRMTDIHGGEILPPEPVARLVPERSIQDQVSFPQRLRSWIGRLFGSKQASMPIDNFDNQLTKDYIKRILAKRGLRP